MTNEEAITIVAEKLMGWPPCRDESCEHFACGMQNWTGSGILLIDMEGFDPFLDATADYEVLEAVREKFSHEQTRSFVEWLKTERWPRCEVTLPFSLELYAKPGDYTLAAAQVLKETP